MSRDALAYPSDHRAFLKPYLPASHTPSQSGRPHITLTFATSLDSSLSLSPGTQTALSGPQSKAMTHYLRSVHDAILIGVGTAIADNPSLNCRLEGVGGYGREGLYGQPRPVVVDPEGRWDVRGTKVLDLASKGKGRAPWVVTARTPRAELVQVLEGCGGGFIVLDRDADGRVGWQRIVEVLSEKGIGSVMIEGGGTVINTLLAAENSHLVDSVIVTIAPTWLGRGGVVVSPERANGPTCPVARLNTTMWHQLGDDVVLGGFLNTPQKS
ncbi:hypothetical protein MBLNU457_5070t1 [Dothideomycetes sp. NU457]